MTDIGKIIKKDDILVGLKTHRYITKSKEYSVFDVNYEHNLFVFQDDTGDYSCYYFSDIGKSLKLKEKSLVGRYLKALCDEPNESIYEEGDYIKIASMGYDGSVYCDAAFGFISCEGDWSHSDVELMPEGFEPSEDMAINNFMEEGLRFRDEFQKELNEIDKEEGEAVCNIFKKTTEEDFQKLCDTLNAPIDEQQFKDNAGIFNKITSNKPFQYQIGIDTFERMRANATYEEAMGFIRWNIDKYNTRQKGQDEDDYKKIISYAQEALWWIKNNK